MSTGEQHIETRSKVVAYTLALSGFLMGYHESIMNSMAILILNGLYRLSEDDRIITAGSLNMYFAVGATFGVLCTSHLIRKIGNSRVKMPIDILIIAVTSMMSIEMIIFLKFSRFLLGFLSTASMMAAGIMLIENFPTRLASEANIIIFIVLVSLMMMTFVQQSIFNYTTLRDHWRIFLCYPSLISLIRFAILFRFLECEVSEFKDLEVELVRKDSVN